MNKLRYVGTDEPLTTEQGQFIKEQAVFAARRAFVARKLFGTAIRKIDAGAQTFGYDTLTEVSNASIDMSWPGRESSDIINLARSTVAIPVLHKEFEINKLDLASSNMAGTPLNTSNAESAGYKVALLEDTLLILGYAADGTNYDINVSSSNETNPDVPATVPSSAATGPPAMADLVRENEMLRSQLAVREKQLRQSLDVANRAIDERKARDNAEKERLITSIQMDSHFTKDELQKKSLADLQTVRLTLDKSIEKTFASVAAEIDEAKRKKKPFLTAGYWAGKDANGNDVWKGGI